jgi:hypothetical protein
MVLQLIPSMIVIGKIDLQNQCQSHIAPGG